MAKMMSKEEKRKSKKKEAQASTKEETRIEVTNKSMINAKERTKFSNKCLAPTAEGLKRGMDEGESVDLFVRLNSDGGFGQLPMMPERKGIRKPRLLILR